MPEPIMRLHPLALAVKCPACGASGLTFIRGRGHGDLYQCGLCNHQVLHALNKAPKSCGYAPISNYGLSDKWTACRKKPAASGPRVVQAMPAKEE